MSQCDTCKNSSNCKASVMVRRLEQAFPNEIGTCSDYEYEKPLKESEGEE